MKKFALVALVLGLVPSSVGAVPDDVTTETKVGANSNTVVVETSLGSFKIELLPKEAPITVKNFLSYVDEQGQFHKPLLLPQKDPAFYESFIKTFNVPEFIRTPITLPARDLAQAIVNPRTVLKPVETHER